MPAKPSNYAMALLSANSKLLSEFGKANSARSMQPANFLDGVKAKFSHAMRFAFFPSKPMPRVNDIFSVRNPLKVINSVIRRVKVNMIDHLRIQSFGNKGRRNKSMDQYSDSFAILVELNSAVTVFSFRRNQDSVSPIKCAFYSSKIRNLIRLFIASDWAPDFFHNQSPQIDVRGKVRGRWHGNHFSGATLAAQGEF